MSVILNEPPDPELERLVTALCDERLGDADRRKLEDRLRDDPASLQYCADRIQFESELHDVVSPPPNLEWSETRRLLKSGERGWELRLERSLYFKSQGRAGLIDRLRWQWSRRWVKGGVFFAGIALAVVLWSLSHSPPAPAVEVAAISPLVLRNGDFEASKLDHTKSGESTALLEWSDYFPPNKTTLVEIARTSNNTFFAHSGRNVVRMEQWGFLTQNLIRKDGSPVVAAPGLRFRVSGWAHVEPGAPKVRFFLALRFVASSWPEMFQYEPAVKRVEITGGGWKHFSEELVLPADLNINRVTKSDAVPAPPSMDITGKALTYSVDNRVESGGVVLFDDLVIEEIPAQDQPAAAGR